MAYALQQLINGVTLGMIYGLIAVGYTMVYGIIGMINFAHGDVFMVGAFIGIIVLTALTGVTSVPLGLLAALILSAALCGRCTGFPSSASPTGRCAARSAWRR
jgi:branched-chain amino acid transport system permease protein